MHKHEFISKDNIIYLEMTEIDTFLRIGYISFALLAVPFYFGCSYLLIKKKQFAQDRQTRWLVILFIMGGIAVTLLIMEQFLLEIFFPLDKYPLGPHPTLQTNPIAQFARLIASTAVFVSAAGILANIMFILHFLGKKFLKIGYLVALWALFYSFFYFNLPFVWVRKPDVWEYSHLGFNWLIISLLVIPVFINLVFFFILLIKITIKEGFQSRNFKRAFLFTIGQLILSVGYTVQILSPNIVSIFCIFLFPAWMYRSFTMPLSFEKFHVEISAFLESSRAVLKYKEFEDGARSIFNYCQKFIGAKTGYIIFLSDKKTFEKFLFFDFDPIHISKRDILINTPIRGSFELAYQNQKTIFINDISYKNPIEEIPQSFDNILISPLVIDNNPIGFYVLENKINGFNDNDVQIISAFNELMTISLVNSQIFDRLRESEEKFRLITEQSLLGIGIIQDSVIKFVNERITEILGYSAEELLNWKSNEFAKIIHPEDLSFVMAQLQKKQSGEKKGVFTHYSYRIRTKTGKIVWIEQYSKTIPYEGKPADFITFIDITERKKFEKKERELQELQDQFIAMTSHELRTPITVIKGYMDFLPKMLDNSSGGSYNDVKDRINRNIDRLIKSIDAVHDLSIIRSGQFEIKRGSVNVEKMANSLESDLTILYPKRMISLHQNFNNNGVKKIFFDEDRMIQVLNNLVSNAVKNSPKGSPIEISIVTTENDLQIKVRDHGSGILKDMTTIFKPFSHKSSQYSSRGTGLGLFITKAIVDAHKGKIEVKSKKGLGSIFTVTIPTIEIIEGGS